MRNKFLCGDRRPNDDHNSEICPAKNKTSQLVGTIRDVLINVVTCLGREIKGREKPNVFSKSIVENKRYVEAQEQLIAAKKEAF